MKICNELVLDAHIFIIIHFVFVLTRITTNNYNEKNWSQLNRVAYVAGYFDVVHFATSMLVP